MAGTTFARELKSKHETRISFCVAGAEDDAEIRRLLRENPMGGPVSLTFEREPSYFRDAGLIDDARITIVAREAQRLVCMGACSYAERFVNGEPRRTGYLAGLRLDARVAGRSDVLRLGYRFFEEEQGTQQPTFYFTSIAAGNQRAIRFLERGLRGMPVYTFIGEFVTLLLPVPHRRFSRQTARQNSCALNKGRIEEAGKICEFLNEHNRHYQLAPLWTSEKLLALRALGLAMDDFVLLRTKGEIVGCVSIWDQRSFKQTVIRGYSPPLKYAKSCLNLLARLSGHPGLPKIGTALPHAYVSHLAVHPDAPELLLSLVRALFEKATGKGMEFLTLGFSKEDPRLQTMVSNFRCHQYRTRLYSVTWGEDRALVPDLDERPLYPEVSLL